MVSLEDKTPNYYSQWEKEDELQDEYESQIK